MSRAPYMQLYPGDYHADTQGLTTEQHGAYLLLLMSMWTYGGTLPNDPTTLRRIAKMTPAKWAKTWAVLSRFFTVEGDQITQPRLREDREKVAENSLKKSKSGKLGAEAKHRKSKEVPLADATRLPQHTISHIPEDEEEELPDGSSSKKERRRGSRLNAEWQLKKAWGDWAMENGLTEAEVRLEAARFRDYWVGIPGAKGVKLDWEATWRNWVRRVVDDRKQRQLRVITGGSQPQQPTGDELMAAYHAKKAKAAGGKP